MEIKVSTPEKGAVDITNRLEENLSGKGRILVRVPHTTAGIVVNEAEPNLTDDIEKFLEEVVPYKDYSHDKVDDNARAHLKTMLLSSSEVFTYTNGKLDLGTWQSVLLVENDGPRTRKVKIEDLR